MDHPDQPASTMLRKFLHGEPWESDPDFDYGTFRKQFYFFYGTLMDHSTLATVLNLQDRPQLFPAKITGYRCMLWGPYPALLDGPQNSPIYGQAYEVQSQQDSERLAAYETDNYKTTSCLIELEDGRQVIGRTFKWNADTSLLREGSFDLKDWQMERVG
ncbi:hypothetical protein FQN54_000873 [Arachnomyces sp. PD_36]|nr:hypothetical protein FQN54_000873 [Arachnomyces sp. PD_36]